MRKHYKRETHQFCYVKNGKNYHHLLYMYVSFEKGVDDILIVFTKTLMVHYEEGDLLVLNYYQWPNLPSLNYCYENAMCDGMSRLLL